MADTEEEEGGKKKKSGLIVTIAIVLVLSLVAAGGGWVLGGILAPQVDTPEVAAADASHGGKGEDKKGHDENKPRENLLPLEPITTNLSYPSDNWIRIEVSLVFAAKPDNVLADQIHEDILAYLRTLSDNPVPFPAVGFTNPLPANVPDRVAALAVFGNPTAKVGLPLTSSPLYGARAIDLCNAGDPVCSGGDSVPAHRDYGPSGLTNQAAAFVAGLL